MSNSSESYKSGFTKLKKLVLVGGPDDGVITPWQSRYALRLCRPYVLTYIFCLFRCLSGYVVLSANLVIMTTMSKYMICVKTLCTRMTVLDFELWMNLGE